MDTFKASVPVVVFRVRAGSVAGSVPDLRRSLSRVKHHRAEGHADQPAPGGGRGSVMKVSTPPLHFCQLSEVGLQHPEVSVGEKEERREAGIITRG